MHWQPRGILDRSFTGLTAFSVALVALSLFVVLGPIVVRGLGAFFFRATVEHRRMMLYEFGQGDRAAVEAEVARVEAARAQVWQFVAGFEEQLKSMGAPARRRHAQELREIKDRLAKLLGPPPGRPPPAMLRERYGRTRWDQAQLELERLLYRVEWDYSDPARMGRQVRVPRVESFRGTALEPMFACLEGHLEDMLRPRWTCYWRFLLDESKDAHFFGGIWPEILGTLYLTVGAIIFAVPMGVISAIYLVEYAPRGWLVGLLRTCISTLAGVPSIVFGLFGLAFFINTIHVSESKSVLAGSLTLAVLILPVIIRASEEAIRAVPFTYKEAALSMGASRWRAITTVTLPAALPGILTGVVISMGRAAGETAPIIFTAAVSVGAPLALWQTLSRGTPALPWNIYNLATEHQAVDEIRHVQHGMVLTLVALVLLLNAVALVLRARIARKLAV